MGPGILPETIVGKHNPPCHLQMPTKALSCKTKPICEHGPEAPLCPVDCLKWTVSKWKSVLWSDESKFDILVGNYGRRVLRAKEEGDLPACYQCSVQKPASLMVWGCISAYGMGSLHVLEGTMNAERYIKVLEQHMLPSRWCLFFFFCCDQHFYSDLVPFQKHITVQKNYVQTDAMKPSTYTEKEEEK